jgi:hypothetical protein
VRDVRPREGTDGHDLPGDRRISGCCRGRACPPTVGVEPTNNHAERGLRGGKTGQAVGAQRASFGGEPASMSASARMCSGRIPQQPPTSCAPRSIQLTDALANASGVMSPKIHSGGL